MTLDTQITIAFVGYLVTVVIMIFKLIIPYIKGNKKRKEN